MGRLSVIKVQLELELEYLCFMQISSSMWGRATALHASKVESS